MSNVYAVEGYAPAGSGGARIGKPRYGGARRGYSTNKEVLYERLARVRLGRAWRALASNGVVRQG